MTNGPSIGLTADGEVVPIVCEPGYYTIVPNITCSSGSWSFIPYCGASVFRLCLAVFVCCCCVLLLSGCCCLGVAVWVLLSACLLLLFVR